MLSSFRHPRKRRVSVGPQSEADAREYLANREQQRRKNRSTSNLKGRDGSSAPTTASKLSQGDGEISSPADDYAPQSLAMQVENEAVRNISTASLRVNAGDANLLTEPSTVRRSLSDSGKDDEKNDRKMFSLLEKPRTHYDVEVITKLVVYAGMISSTCQSHARANTEIQALRGLQ